MFPTIEDYAPISALFSQFAAAVDDNQPGDPDRCVNAVIDVIRGEGLARGKPRPHVVPLGSDSLLTIREYAKALLKTCDTWEVIAHSVDFPGPKKGVFAQLPHYHHD